MLRDLVVKNRSYRRFHEDHCINAEELRGLVDLARLSATGGNMQPLKFFISSDPASNARIFPCLAWAAYLKDWPGPVEGERPSAYIVILGDTRIATNYWCNHGIAAQSILLGAVEKGLGGCMIAAVNKKKLADALGMPGRYEVLLVIALGMPAEEVRIEPVGPDGDIRYWRDEKGVHHVPKRPLDEIVIERF
ncbi:MAG TPA: nitroreductase family protein [Deltaproteobacteria bacterium]|nr:nitroreductase family protein [Deltaproteobacteria bacterium]HPR54925.1 nitroreductase family protein [Deltaproteobacteria bacterium]HXK47758.1 nitroreductase family protein [Deltaproteobacteria bacterium]